jgi:hypothetical protein
MVWQIGFGKFGNLANGRSNNAYIQKSMKLGISVFARWRDSSLACILLPHAYSFSRAVPSKFLRDCSMVSPSSVRVPVADLVESLAAWNPSYLLASLDVPP